MKIVNVHQRLLHGAPDRVSALLSTLGSPNDQVWPRNGWPRMVLDRPLGVGAKGGHGPVRYYVEAHEPQFTAFRFTKPGVNGWHAFEILDSTQQHCVLEHRIEADFTGLMLLKWLFVVRWLHDACVEDALSQAQVSLGQTPRRVPWSPYVRFLMRVMSRRLVRRPSGKTHAA
jgi:hypothetical protein